MCGGENVLNYYIIELISSISFVRSVFGISFTVVSSYGKKKTRRVNRWEKKELVARLSITRANHEIRIIYVCMYKPCARSDSFECVCPVSTKSAIVLSVWQRQWHALTFVQL